MRIKLSQIAVVVLIALLSAGGFLLYQNSKFESGISKDVLKKVAFKVFTYDPSLKDWELETSTITYDKTQGILTLNFIGDANKITVIEQLTPDVFTDIPNYYTILLSKLRIYSEIQTPVGTVGLTKPEELNGGQTAVLNSGGTLMFYRPEKNLSDDQWRKFFSSLVIIK